MKNILLISLFLPFCLWAQDPDLPYVQFDQDAILWYIPGQSAYAPLLPIIKPGFVHIIQTTGFLRKSIPELSSQLTSTIQYLTSTSMSMAQKTEFFERYACLILLNYNNLSSIDSSFLQTVRSLRTDPDREIRERAVLTVKMFDMYKQE